MTSFLRRNALVLTAALPLFAGCASMECEYLTYEEEPRKSPAIVMPADVPAPAERGKYRIPDGPARAITGRCPAEPPMTLDPELLIDPEEREDVVPEEAAPEA